MPLTSSHQYSLAEAIKRSVILVALLWIIQSAGVLFNLPLANLAVYPHAWDRLYGILSAPLVHSGYEHLFNNTLPLVVLGSALLYGYPATRNKVLLLVWLGSGIGVWMFAREANHLGASGIAHGMFFYLFVGAILRRDARSVGLMLIAFLMYGTMILTIFPTEPDISYEAHFFGAVSGGIAALLWWKQDPKPTIKRYSWENPDEADDPVIGELWQQSPHPDDDEGYKEK
ncbi:rhomboid family intramembrane serine protease [Salinimonas sediminis]|uniref:Rhomboid family intramembrane serine protease n=2 Tax=Salinimonas sediminis TaxID=2303538 RepID=A0A346NSE7_9ALTE|nr:rhomboid family intramembrane serine protease [Salinimonas sediminis]